MDQAERPNPARVVADADVLAADLLCGGPADAAPDVDGLDAAGDGAAARAALDHLRAHSWATLVATGRLLDDAEAVVADLADPGLAADWRERIEDWAVVVEQTPGDHPALAAAHAGPAAHILTFEESLASAGAGATLRKHLDVSVRHPRAFAQVFDAAALWAAVHDADPDEYPGPDRDPRE
ncbi:DUF7384 family protein [Haloglomus salinum]|jgi:hypothetical protein|uniref:DUF7384 family protein n=1 Tax=Haloglomus salinum TaxID=2962673 RepID=UPI0020CA1150|nr:hypothetical protein [Haloglomus salinum]